VIFAGAILFLTILKFIKVKKTLSPNSTILITGGCMGLGKEIALNFASNHKCNIIIYDIQTNLSTSLLEEIKKAGGKGHFYECDISNQEMVAKVFKETTQKFQMIDILVKHTFQ